MGPRRANGPLERCAPLMRINVYTAGFLRDHHLRRMLECAGYDVRLGLPGRGAGGQVAVWGRTRYARRGRWIARRFNAGLITIEDAFLRSVLTGRSGAPPHGIVIDRGGIYFDCSGESDLENILNTADLAAPDLAMRATAAMARLDAAGLSKYNNFDPDLELGETGYILLVDQTRNDASITFGGADAATFTRMLAAARAENPGQRILIKTHPEVAARYRQGHFGANDSDETTRIVSEPISPLRLLKGADKVYCVTSQIGFEAILAGHRPVVFGRPFYGGWGLSDDRQPFQRRQRQLTAPELFTGAMLLYPTWYDPYRDALCQFETVVDNLAAQARAWQEDSKGYVAIGMRLWKRRHLRRFFGAAGASLVFQTDAHRAAKNGRRGMVWASRETASTRAVFAANNRRLLRLEDGFLRSRGLGADLVPPMSLVLDDLGIYYDPNHISRLEARLNASGTMSAQTLQRARSLRNSVVAAGLGKYNIGGQRVGSDWPRDQRRILVPGQVEDDASIRLGTGAISTNLALLGAVRQQNPDAFIAYKPHPDIEAGLRPGQVSNADLAQYADVVVTHVNAIAAIDACDEVWTMTSLIGFEALLRQKPVTCLGTPFYAGWGLTRDLDRAMPRRQARLSLDHLVYAALIAYPRYFDPVTGLACPVEVVVERLQSGSVFRANRGLAKLQGLLASFAPVWR